MFPISVWPQVAEILGESASAPFAGGLWHLIARITAPLGFAPPVGVCLLLAAAAAIWMYGSFVLGRGRRLFTPAFIIAGALLADTPFAILLIAGMEVMRTRRCRQIERRGGGAVMPVIDQMMARAMSALAIGFVVVAGYNIYVCGLDEYVIGYARAALNDVKAGHLLHPVDNWRAASAVKEFARGMAAELGGSRWCFSDGSCDDGAGVFAACAGKKVVFLPLTGLDERNLRAVEAMLDNYEDRAAIASGSAALLKTWIDSGRGHLNECTVQTGFTVWKSRRLPLPRPGCFLADCAADRTAVDIDDSAAVRVAESVFAFYDGGGELDNLSEDLRRRFLAVQWRLSRMARVRGEWYDGCDRTEKAKAAMELSDRLDAVNPQAQEAFRKIDMMQMAASCAVSPREGLDFALRSANFPLAHQLAKSILLSEPENARANFAAGMDYLLSGNLTLAEEHLRIVLKSKPEDPAVLNNLAIALRKQGRRDEALEYAKKAQSIRPDASEIKETLRSLQAD